ncbi:energy transducer TonB [Litoribrevibacter euphylliae]|uniref:Energy transducer TonB n=1 Tax=Litoribrevibacter euphylliae TaxID=1834034 RepID=A0ABV7HD22_9GAMM
MNRNSQREYEPLNNNNKKIIWITCAISVLLHLVTAPFIPNIDFSSYQQPQRSKTISLALIHEEKKSPLENTEEPLPSQPKHEEKKSVVPPKKKPEAPLKKETKKELKQADLLTGPSTSRKQKPDEELSKIGGDRRKGDLKGKKEAKSPSSKTAEPVEPTTNTSSTKVIGNAPKKKQIDTASLTPPQKGASEQPSQTHSSQKQAPPNQAVTQSRISPSPLATKSKLKKPNQSKIKNARISFAQLDSDSPKEVKKSNPLFDAINQATPATQINHQIGGLKQLHDKGLGEARLGDPLSGFERKQRKVYNKYLAIMSEQVNEHWDEPKSQSLLLTRVRLYLTLEGYIKDIYIEESSGHSIFDAEALRAIKAVKQFHMPPSPAAAGYLTRLTMTVDNYSEPGN